MNCPILAALSSGRKPPEWTRNPRAQLMKDTIKCNEYRTTPPRPKPAKHFDDVPLFDETPYKTDVGYVPVDGWPERPKGKDVDHQ